MGLIGNTARGTFRDRFHPPHPDRLDSEREGDSLGGIFAVGSSSAFGSRSGNVLTRTTYILGTLFLLTKLRPCAGQQDSGRFRR
jgi:hypothetical protein